MKAVLVKDSFYIDEDWIHTVAEDSEYWEASAKFYDQVKERTVDSLSDKQREWLTRIENKYLSQQG